MAFSSNGIDFTYIPTPDAAGFETTVRAVRINPAGTFQGASGSTPTQFDLRILVRVQ